MTDVQKFAAVAVRLVAAWIFSRGAIALVGLVALRGSEMGQMMMAMVPRASLLLTMIPILLGIVLFLGAPTIARMLTYDFD